MSSGIDADIALDAAVVLSLGVARLAGAGAGLAGRGAEALAARAAGRAEARAAALAEVETHERALREAVERNARIDALAETRSKLGADVALPAAIGLDERSAAELTAWCAATDAVLDEAERHLSEHLAAQVSAQIFAVPAEGLETDTGQGAPPPRADDVREHLERIMARLLPDATEAERLAVAEAARLLADAATAAEAEGVLQEVRLRIQDANRRTRGRRDEERRLAAERDAAEQAVAERRYVLDSITTAFEDLGYEVQAGFETLTAEDGSVTLTKGAWPDHSVRMRVDDAAHVRASMVRERPAESEDDRRLDVEREEEWCSAFESARERLAAAGIRSDVGWRLEPGVRELPVSASARQTRGRVGQRERSRERHK
ncbi:response regulator receiver protein [Actinomadura darangshiensis]|uniref:Response regulator receiver protein n=1 Tax=Actinomadura darangshiensis TaxID=705336 RepID=A0A4R5AW93_9ACTN|nr:response regulator receiver protein [Actinomadura darangshiensis]TDD76785.1 response regulator receiver protein [Actinomadura darangshiensis]